MKITRANVDQYAKEKGLEPIKIDGIPEGFSFIEDSLTIGNITHVGNYVGFLPLAKWENGVVKSPLIHEFIILYNKKLKEHYAK